jgi:hypothetical protein
MPVFAKRFTMRPRSVLDPAVTTRPSATVPPPEISTRRATGCVVPSMTTGEVIVGRALARVIVGMPLSATGIAKAIVSAPGRSPRAASRGRRRRPP